MSIVAALLSCLALVASPTPEPPARPEVHAKAWFNNPPFRLNDDRDVVLLFFSAKDPERSLTPIVRRLNQVCRRPDTVVLGLTADGRGEAQAFIKRYRVQFTIGASSRSPRDFKIAKTPAIIRIKRKWSTARAVWLTPMQPNASRI